MSIATNFKSGRTGAGAAFTSDHSGSAHARFMRLSSYALAPLGLVSAWYIAGLAGKTIDGVHAEIGRPFPAIVLVAFGFLGMLHARQGMDEIIEDYIHDPAMKEMALRVNKLTAIGVAAIWTLAILIIAAPK